MKNWCVKLVQYAPYRATLLIPGGLKKREALDAAEAYATNQGGYEQTTPHRWKHYANKPDVVVSRYGTE